MAPDEGELEDEGGDAVDFVNRDGFDAKPFAEAGLDERDGVGVDDVRGVGCADEREELWVFGHHGRDGSRGRSNNVDRAAVVVRGGKGEGPKHDGKLEAV